MFGKIKKAFKKVKKDIAATRASVNDWIWFLNNERREMKIKLHELEDRIRHLEWEKKIEVIEE